MLREKEIELTSGVNVLYGLKETEMNIVFIFVKSMFFGVPEEMQAKKECRAYLKVLESQTNMEFTYPQ